ncbi:MAG: GntR family transcriptional regulator [Croceibacterium sp.]
MSELVTWLRERIRIGRYMPGQRLIEPDLMRETGNSRGRVREALQRLQTEGLVVIEEFRGASVRTFTPDDMRQIYRARMALEGLAAHDCAAFGSDDAKTMIRDLQEQMNGCEHTGEHRRFAQLNDAWHDAIIAAADNEYLRNFIVRLRVPLYRLLFSAFYEPERIDDANAGHRQITDAIVIGDAETAERLMRAHVAEAMAVAIRLEEEMASS